MNWIAPIVSSRTAVALLILAAAVGVWSAERHRLSNRTQRLEDARARQAALQTQIAASNAALEKLHRELREEKIHASRIGTEGRAVADQLAQLSPDAAWAEPPHDWPDWDPDSPYVWLHKDLLRQIRFPAFGKDGRLLSETATLLAVNQPALESLNGDLTGDLARYRALELTNAVRTEDGLLNGDSSKEPRITVRIPPMPDQGAAARDQFVATLRTALGDQRAQLLEDAAGAWFDSEFSGAGAEEKTVSLQRLQEGGYRISIEAGKGNRMSVSGPAEPERYLPPHLLSLFRPLLDPTTSAPP